MLVKRKADTKIVFRMKRIQLLDKRLNKATKNTRADLQAVMTAILESLILKCYTILAGDDLLRKDQ